MRSRRLLLTALMVTGVKVARARFRLSRGTWEPVVTLPTEMPKWKTHADQSPDAWHRGGRTGHEGGPSSCRVLVGPAGYRAVAEGPRVEGACLAAGFGSNG